MPFIALLALTQACGQWDFAAFNDQDDPGRFGYAVAASGDQAIVGAPEASSGGLVTGAAHVLVRSGGSWVEEQKLAPIGVTDYAMFGNAVAVCESLAVVGAPEDDDVGSCFVYRKEGDGWQLEQELEPPTESDQEFGMAVACQAGTIMVSAFASVSGQSGGAVFVYEQAGDTWEVVQILTDGAFTSGTFGHAIALDGDRCVVGAPYSSEGQAFAFRRVFGTWAMQGQLESTVASTEFGVSVALSGSRALIGDPKASSSQGRVHLFEEVGGVWGEGTFFVAPGTSTGDRFGASVAFAGDKLVGASPRFEGIGKADVFRANGTGIAHEGMLLGCESPGSQPEYGTGLAGAQGTVLLGGPNACDDTCSEGRVYSFREESPDVWVGAGLHQPNAGISVAAGGSQILPVNAGRDFAGALCALVGSASGTSPGFTAGGIHVALNPDQYLVWTLLHANEAPLLSSLFFLDGEGTGTGSISLGPGQSPSLAGVDLDHVALLLDPLSLELQGATHAEPLHLL